MHFLDNPRTNGWAHAVHVNIVSRGVPQSIKSLVRAHPDVLTLSNDLSVAALVAMLEHAPGKAVFVAPLTKVPTPKMLEVGAKAE